MIKKTKAVGKKKKTAKSTPVLKKTQQVVKSKTPIVIVRPVKRISKKKVISVTPSSKSLFSTDIDVTKKARWQIIQEAEAHTFQVEGPTAWVAPGTAMDAVPTAPTQFGLGNTNLPELLIAWYGSQGFIGSMTCAFIAQHWLVDKACTIPARDAARNGYRVMRNDGGKISPKLQNQIRQLDTKYRVHFNLVQFSRMCRIFGIRIMLFKVETNNPTDYYFKPFNIDGVPPNSYRGMSQIDPYWITPQLDMGASADPSDIYFYEPTWWTVNGMQIHRTHFVIIRTNEVADVLKPTYVYAGTSVPQRICERVYGAERTANEAPMLAMTKRTGVLNIDTTQAVGNQKTIESKLARWAYLRDNYGVHALGTDETYTQTDTALTDLDAIIMTQYQIVAAIAEVPAVKLMGTSPKGFNASGTYEETSYHESLKSIQMDEMLPMLERHYLLLMKSEFSKQASFDVSIQWSPLNTPTAEQRAIIDKTKADTDVAYFNTGAIDGQDIRERIAGDEDSLYAGLDTTKEVEEPEGSERGNDDYEGDLRETD